MSRWIKAWAVQPIHVAVVLLAAYFALHRPSLLSLSLALGFTGIFFYRYGWRRVKKVMPLLLCFLAWFACGKWQSEQLAAHAPASVTEVCILPDTIKVNGASLSFRGLAKGRTYQVFYRLKSEEEQAFFKNLSEPLVLDVEAEVEVPQGQRNFNGFDYKAYLKTQGIARTLRITEIKSSRKMWSVHPLIWLSSLRRKALVHIHETFPAPMSHYMTGLLFGELDSDFAEMSDVYSSLGIIHLFALSGMQVGFFVDKFRYLLLRLGIKRETVDKLQVPFSFVYAGLTGFSVSVVRSLLQKLFAIQGLRGLDNLAVTVLACLVLPPYALLTVGGVLSFTYAFILTVLELEEVAGFKKTVMESLVLSLGILPLLLFYFSSFQPVSIVLTLIVSFVFDVLLLPGLSILFLLSPFVAVTQVNPLFSWLETCLVWVFELVPRAFVFGRPTVFVLLALLVFLGLVYDHVRSKRRMWAFLVCAAALFVLVKHPLDNEVTMVDVGQGDSIFLRDRRGKTILIDVGGRVDFAPKEDWQKSQTAANAQRTLIPYLKSRGVGRIDHLVLTHTDTDHVGDVEVVAREFNIGEILVSPGSLTDESFVKRLEALQVKVRVLKAGDSLPIMGSQLQVLYPWEKGDGGNNDSIVLYGRLLDKNFLFTGDLEEGELDLVARYPQLPVHVLKAGHHGSKGSSYPAFLDHIGAEIALVSAGQDNRYQHPHRETLERFVAEDMTVYRTDQDGAVRFRGARKWTIETVR